MNKFFLIIIICSFQLSHSQNSGTEYYRLNDKPNNETEILKEHSEGIHLTTDRFGNKNSAYNFSQERNSYISLREGFDFISGQNSKFSLSVWFKRSDLSKSNIFLMSKYATPFCNENEREIVFNINSDNKLQFIYYTTKHYKDLRVIESNIAINDTDWHHAVVTYNGKYSSNNGLDRVRLYLDGKESEKKIKRSEGNLGNIQNSTAIFCIGSALNSKGQTCMPKDKPYTFEGTLDDINIYDKKISLRKIKRLYKQKNKMKDQ